MNKNKRHILIAITASIIMLMIGGVIFIQIERNYQANQPVLEACLDNEGTVVLEKKYAWSLSTASCEHD